MPGDVFFANFMTAHFIAPNTSPFIRYAIYFRVKSHRFGTTLHNSVSMLDPWAHWDCMQVNASPLEVGATRSSDACSSNGEGSGRRAASADRENIEFSDHDDVLVRARPPPHSIFPRFVIYVYESPVWVMGTHARLHVMYRCMRRSVSTMLPSIILRCKKKL